MSDASNYPVITICREYAAGGRSVGRKLSEILGIPWYDKDFVKETVRNSGIDEEAILREGEELGSGAEFLDSMLNSMVGFTSSHDSIYRAQAEEAIRLATKGPCIIVGRCSNIILQNAGIPSFDVFLYADINHRIARTVELGDADESDALKYIEKRDKLRHNYYKHYTGKDHGDYCDYDLMLNTGIFGYERAAEIIASCIKQK